MAHFSLKITGQRLAVTQVVIASDTTDYLTGEVSVTSDWDGAELWVHFKKDEEIHSVIVEEGVIPADKHINLTAGVWQVWCLGLKYEDGEVVQRITTTVCTITVNRTGGLGGDPFPETGDSPVAQLLAKIAEANANAAEAKEDSVTALTRANSAVADVDRRGVPSGGEPGYCLVKSSGDEYETAWVPSSNPYNLLDNSDFGNPVNQKGEAVYTHTSNLHSIDRWFHGQATLTLADGYANWKTTSAAAYKRLVQKVGVKFSAGKTYTVAMLIRINSLGGNVSLRLANDLSAVSGASKRITSATADFGWFLFTHTAAADIAVPCFDLLVGNTADDYLDIDIKAAAIYEGEYTAETMPKYQPKGYGAELAECQRYYRLIGSADKNTILAVGVGYTENAMYIPIQGIQMRGVYSVKAVTDIGTIKTTTDTIANAVSVTGISAYNAHDTAVSILINGTFVRGTPYTVWLEKGVIEINANL